MGMIAAWAVITRQFAPFPMDDEAIRRAMLPDDERRALDKAERDARKEARRRARTWHDWRDNPFSWPWQ